MPATASYRIAPSLSSAQEHKSSILCVLRLQRQGLLLLPQLAVVRQSEKCIDCRACEHDTSIQAMDSELRHMHAEL